MGATLALPCRPSTEGSARQVRRPPLDHWVRSRLLVCAFTALLVLTGSGGSCSEGSREPTTPSVPDVVAASLGSPELRLVVVTDLMGMIEPCGCTSRPLGGIDGLSAALSAARAEHGDTLLLAAGDLYFGATHPSDLPGAETQELWRSELVADLLSDFQLAAGVPGTHDVEDGVAGFLALRARSRFPLLGAGVTFDALVPAATSPTEPAVEPTPIEPLAGHRIVTLGGRSIGLVGVSSMTAIGVHGPTDLIAAAEAEARLARSEGAQLVIVLSTTDRRTARRIASSDDVDLVIEGARDEAEVRPPASSEGAPVISAGRHGQGLVIVDLFGLEGLRGSASSGRLRDVSTWTRTVERDHLVEQTTELRARLAEWESSGTASEADLADVRGRLRSLESELSRIVAAPSTTGPVLSLRHVELPPDAPRDPLVRTRMDDFFRRVNHHNREAFASHLPTPAAEGHPHFTGSETCGGCHTEELTWWRTTLHGHAYQTLVDRDKEYNLDCVGCHVTGYEMPGGATVSHVGDLQDVGCENCHGPGSMHLSDPVGAAVNVRLEAPEDVCLRCHTPEHSDRFDYATYLRMMITAEHGGADAVARVAAPGGTP